MRWVRGVEVGCLRGVHAGAAADGEEAVEITRFCEFDTGFKGLVRRLDLNFVEDGDADIGVRQGLLNCRDAFELCDGFVRVECNAGHAERFCVMADFPQRAGPNLIFGGVTVKADLRPSPWV